MDKKEIQAILEEAMEKGREAIPYGEVASYIPELSKADNNHLGLCIYTKDGRRYSIGDTNVRFTIQSISKIITLAVALESYGFDEVFEKVDVEPSGEAFNSLIDLDLSSNKPLNPMINSGALTVTSMLLPKVTFSEMKIFAKKLCM
ncbi:MAG: glutaminase, partial [Firmicutes bacterium]|nr:glutaminase [Bacillota bacterium]